MRRLILIALSVLVGGCISTTVIVLNPDRRADAAPAGTSAGGAAPRLAQASATTHPTIVAKWTPGAYPKDEVNLIAMGDWGANNNRQKEVARTLASYLAGKDVQFNGVLTCGDNFYVPLKDNWDKNWKTVFEDMYDAQRLNFPFYVALGNHDYDNGKDKIELAYPLEHPDSRFKLPSRWYRLDLPEERPIVTILVLDSNRWNMSVDEWNKQLKWIDDELAKPRQTRWTVCVGHHTLYSNGDHGDSYTLKSDWGDLLKKHKVDFYVCGHDHSLQHLQLADFPTSLVIAGGGGQTRKEMWRDDRGPFSRKLYGFAHLHFTSWQAEVTLVDGLTGEVAHQFTRDSFGQIAIRSTTPSDKARSSTLASVAGVLTNAERPVSPAIRALQATGDDYQQMEKVLSFSTEQRSAFQKALADRNAGYESWSKTDDGEKYVQASSDLNEAKQSGDQQRIHQVQVEYNKLRAKQEAQRLRLRREFNLAISLKMQQRWAGHLLFKAVIGRFTDADLSDEQKQQAFAACVTIAAQVVDEKKLEADPYLKPDEAMQTRAADVIHDHVLTTKQREKLASIQNNTATSPDQNKEDAEYSPAN